MIRHTNVQTLILYNQNLETYRDGVSLLQSSCRKSASQNRLRVQAAMSFQESNPLKPQQMMYVGKKRCPQRLKTIKKKHGQMTPISTSPRQIQTCHMNQSIYATTCYHCKSWFTSKLMVNVYRCCIQYTMIQYIMLETFRIWCNEVRAFTKNLKPIGTLLS